MGQSIVRDLAPQSEHLQNPNADRNYNHYIQNGLDAGGHGDVVIDQPQRDADHNRAMAIFIKGMSFSLSGDVKQQFVGRAVSRVGGPG